MDLLTLQNPIFPIVALVGLGAGLLSHWLSWHIPVRAGWISPRPVPSSAALRAEYLRRIGIERWATGVCYALVSVMITYLMRDDLLMAGPVILLSWGLGFLCLTDLRDEWVPERVTWPLFFLGGICSPFESDPLSRWGGAALGAGLMWICFWGVGKWKRRDVMSGGDVMLAMVAGAWLGFEAMFDYLILAVILFMLHVFVARRPDAEGGEGDFGAPMGPALSIAMLLIGFSGVRMFSF